MQAAFTAEGVSREELGRQYMNLKQQEKLLVNRLDQDVLAELNQCRGAMRQLTVLMNVVDRKKLEQEKPPAPPAVSDKT